MTERIVRLPLGDESPTARLLYGIDARDGLRLLDPESVQCVVTSPPYWALRDYGADGQIGLEESPDLYVTQMVEVFREVRRVLKSGGTLWLNLGDNYTPPEKSESGLKPKDLVGIPWRVALALQADGWWLRQDIIWAKTNPMPEPVTDRCTKAHEYLFLLTKSPTYFYNHEAIKEPTTDASIARAEAGFAPTKRDEAFKKISIGANERARLGLRSMVNMPLMRNKRSVWMITAKPYPGAHFATFPEALVRPCLLAGSASGDTVLDPFSGSGTVGAVALSLGRNYVGTDINESFLPLAESRVVGGVAPDEDAPIEDGSALDLFGP